MESGDGIIVLTDLFGGTASNLAIAAAASANVEVLAGTNLPMLAKLAQIRTTCRPDAAVAAAREAACNYIKSCSTLLS